MESESKLRAVASCCGALQRQACGGGVDPRHALEFRDPFP